MTKFVLNDNFKVDYENAKAKVGAVDMSKLDEAVIYAQNSGNEILINAMAEMKDKALQPIQADIDFIAESDKFISKYVNVVEVEDIFQQEADVQVQEEV